jgi:hypothetical protein
MLRFTTLSLVFSLFTYWASGQEIKDGFIILSNGEYEYGYVQFDPTLNVYEECLFSVATSKPYTKFTPDQIRGYGVINGIHFATREVTTGASHRKHFLKNELDNPIRIYSFNDSRFFIERDTVEELTESNYKILLSEGLKSCKGILSSIKKTHFDLQGIRTVINKFLRCSDPESLSIPFTRFQFETMAGLEFNNIRLRGGQLPFADIALIDKTLFSVGINANILFKKSKKLSGVTGAYYYQQNFYAIKEDITTDYSSVDKINVNYKELLIPVALQYSFFKKEKRVMPYIKTGVLIPITFKSALIWESEKEYSNSVLFQRYALPQKLKQSLQSAISVGATFEVINDIRNVFEVSYIMGSGKLSSGGRSLSTNSNRFVFLLGFRF